MKAKTLLFTLSAATLIAAGGLSVKASDSWNYGYTFSTGYSNYLHPTRYHAARVVNKTTGNQGYGEAVKGVWAKALVGRNVTEKCSFYYNYW
ncbi:hypothetical protein FACS1894192_01640 [Bacilli bacterium]|nr:hypothetical protein FACS1894192_01640 [Bacilli bacterium]